MIFLAFETSTSRGSVALWRDGSVSVEILPDAPHSETLLPASERLLEGACLGRDQVEALAVGVGPGAFTGLRVGIATAQGWARGAGISVVSVPSLDAEAFPFLRQGKRVGVVADARKGEFYAAFYRGLSSVGEPERVGEILLLTPGQIGGWIRDLPAGTVLVGTGLPALPSLPASRDRVFGECEGPRAEEVARLGALLLASGRGGRPESLLPLYVRPPDALPSRTPTAFLPPR